MRLIFFFLWVFFELGNSVAQQGTVYCQDTVPPSECTVKLGVLESAGTAFGTFQDDLSVTGWGKLKVQTSANPKVSDLTKMYAIGYLEGVLTRTRIIQQIDNMYSIIFSNTPNQKVEQWLDDQENWVRQNIAGKFNTLSPYWKQVALIMSQFDGIADGFETFSTDEELQKMAVPVGFAFQMLSGWGDLLDLIPALSGTSPDWSQMTQEQIGRELGSRGHCSALIKVLGDFSDIFMAQAAWFDYSAMNRIYKHYYFDISTSGTSSKKVSFSSYPGCLVSIDDFYIMDSGLVMLQTTNSIVNHTLYRDISSNALLAWQRVRLANAMASDGQTWSQIISTYNSGTYNNQYMVIDLKKFHVGSGLDDGAFWVSEQIPGQVVYADETEILRYGYFPSYNVPFFEEIWLKSGYQTLGKNWTHSIVPRAEIFRRDQGSVVDINSMKNLMRSNNYKTDPYSKGDPGNAICSRFDLETTSPGAFGCYDTKVTNYKSALALISQAVNGPTTEKLPPFSWTGKFAAKIHEGMPTTFNFSFETMNPQW